MVKFETYKFITCNEDWYMLMEQNNLSKNIARVYSLSISFEDFNFGIYNTLSADGLFKVSLGNHPDWNLVTFEDFIKIKKGIGTELQDKIDNLFEMIKNENYDCYEGKEYIIHVPRYQFRIAGPKFKYVFSDDSTESYESYFIKTTDNDDRLEQTLNQGFVKIGENNFGKIIEIWSSFFGLLLSESKYF